MNEVTRILSAIEQGDPQAAEQLLPLVYDTLRRLAAEKLAQEKPGQTLQATALVHEAYIRLVEVEKAQHWRCRGHFFAAAAEAMRRILVSNARQKMSQKRGGDCHRVDIDMDGIAAEDHRDKFLTLDDAIAKLASVDPQKAELVKLRYYAGLNAHEAAVALDLSEATIGRYWTYARAWLQREMARGED
jgi:RNA polymerase sigma factor (TIGR02999 family)